MSPAPRIIALQGSPRDGWVEIHPEPLRWPPDRDAVKLVVRTMFDELLYLIDARDVNGPRATAHFIARL